MPSHNEPDKSPLLIMIDYLVFYAVLAIFQPCDGGTNRAF